MTSVSRCADSLLVSRPFHWQACSCGMLAHKFAALEASWCMFLIVGWKLLLHPRSPDLKALPVASGCAVSLRGAGCHSFQPWRGRCNSAGRRFIGGSWGSPGCSAEFLGPGMYRIRRTAMLHEHRCREGCTYPPLRERDCQVYHGHLSYGGEEWVNHPYNRERWIFWYDTVLTVVQKTKTGVEACAEH